MGRNTFLCTILLLACLSLSQALNPAELATLTSLHALFPALGSINAVDEIGADSTSYGGSWNTKPLADVCSNGVGWDIHGVFCGSGGHIEGLRLYVRTAVFRIFSIIF